MDPFTAAAEQHAWSLLGVTVGQAESSRNSGIQFDGVTVIHACGNRHIDFNSARRKATRWFRARVETLHQ